MTKLTPQERHAARQAHSDFLKMGVRMGWWEDYDTDAGLPVRVIKISEMHDTALMAHAWVKLNKFRSVKEAKRAGWGKPATPGTYRIGTWILRIEQ